MATKKTMLLCGSLAQHFETFDEGGMIEPLNTNKADFLKTMANIFDVCLQQKINAQIVLRTDISVVGPVRTKRLKRKAIK